MKKVVIIGGGFGGLNAAKLLDYPEIELTVIDRTNHHLFQPLLYQVASSALSPGDIATPIRAILKSQKNTTVILGDVSSISKEKKYIELSDSTRYDYDYLVVATGSRHHYFGQNQWESYAPGLKTIKDALRIRERILLSFEQAETLTHLEHQKSLMTFVVVGGGPTGVELAGAIKEIASKTMMSNFRNIDPGQARVILVEGGDRLLMAFPPALSARAKSFLEGLGVEVRLSAMVTEVSEVGVKLGDVQIETPNIIWAAGNRTGAVLKTLELEQDKIGRIFTSPDLSIPGFSNVFIIGDAAHLKGKDDQPLPGIAPVAIQQGKYVAKLILREVRGKPRGEKFQYFDKGIMATIGKARAVVQTGNLQFSGLFAWLVWIFVHVMYLIGFRNRFVVITEWMWNYITGQRAARLITNPAVKKKAE